MNVIPITGVSVDPARLHEIRDREIRSQRALRGAMAAEVARRERAEARTRAAVAAYLAEAPIRRALGLEI